MSIYKKLFTLRNEVKPMKKDKKGHNYTYFDINQMIDQIQPLLSKHGLIIIQPLTHVNGKMALETIITDTETDEKITSTIPLIELNDAQKMGGCITYFRRYALQSLLFLEAEDDDAQNTKPILSKPVSQPKTYQKPYQKTYSMPDDGAPFPN